MENKKLRILLITCLIIGAASFFLVITGAAMSYSDNASFCLNCHVMSDYHSSLQLSSHKQFKCTECHAPHDYVPKIIFKTKSGLRDLYATASGNIPGVIKVTDESKEIITLNCIRCHKTTVENTSMGQGRFCTDCHREIAHKKPIKS